MGIEILYGAEMAGITGRGRVRKVVMKDGQTLPCDIFLACVGIKPNITLAEEAGIAVGRGVIVDDRMETSVPGAFAAGDVAERNDQVLGLWPIAAKQAEIAAVNLLGGDERLPSDMPAIIVSVRRISRAIDPRSDCSMRQTV